MHTTHTSDCLMVTHGMSMYLDRSTGVGERLPSKADRRKWLLSKSRQPNVKVGLASKQLTPNTSCDMMGDTKAHRESRAVPGAGLHHKHHAACQDTSLPNPSPSHASGWHGWVLARSAGLRVSRAGSSNKQSQGAVRRVGRVGAHWGPSLRADESRPLSVGRIQRLEAGWLVSVLCQPCGSQLA